MAITAKQVNELRKITGAGMMDCKKALVEADGDIEKAIDSLRKKGQKVAAKREDREAAEGTVLIHINEDSTEAIAFALKCETDFVAKNEDFKSLGTKILAEAVKNQAESAEALAALEIDGVKISEQITEYIGKIGEKIEITSYTKISGEKIIPYIHGDNKIGVLVELTNVGDAEVTEAGKDVAMQIAAMNPVAVNEEGIDPELVEREKQIGIEKARQEGKPEQILEKIAEGFVKKFYKENTLLNQAFVKDNKLTVQQYLDSVQKGLTVKSFSRISIGR
ncbi:translation elongation factor Ts [Rapidithrix thailandica]|uniref:Elongation factor Ts n=1 Tax=Rapidithrix thailandica TaxID=413964 RepID=A0AAW9RU88_9BACT